MDTPDKKRAALPDSYRREIEALSKVLDSPSLMLRLQIGQNSPAARLSEAMRVALGPWEDLRKSGALDGALGASGALAKAMQDMQRDFRLPELNETARLFDTFKDSFSGARLAALGMHTAEIARAMEGLHGPWLNTADALRSVAGMAELQGIGVALKSVSAFDAEVVASLRECLGDWSRPIVWPQGIFDDVVARSSFYAAQGFDPRLSEFPAQAFQESAEIAGLITEPPLAAMYAWESREADGEEDDEEEEEGFARTNAAHDRLQRFETQVRKFIEERMNEAFGNHWMKQRVPGELRKKWLERQETARKNGEQERPLIAFADFTDYVPVLTRKDNWEAVFKPVFRRTEFVTESFQRLYPIRVCTMHARLITQDDELYLYVEVKRFLKAIGIEK